MAVQKKARKAKTPRSVTSMASGKAATERLVPLHYQMYLLLRRRLLQGYYDGTAPMPAEVQLAAQFNVSRVTIRRTLERLEEERLVVRRHGVGTFAGDIAHMSAKTTAHLGSLRQRLVGPEHERWDLRLVSFGKVPAPPFLNADRLSFGGKVLRIQRVSLHGTRPAHFVTSYVPDKLAGLISRDSLGNRTVLEALEKAAVQIGEAEVTVSAAAADSVAATHLQVHVGSPLLVTQRLTRDHAGTPIEYFEAASRPDEYALQFTSAGESGKGRPIPWRGPA